ncbi:MAG: STAS domain-containing protein [Pseudonocardiales bacterium]|nr:STAS domain-containing protein [Pseudonocardiales bacterium]MBV9729270.1 STAS domain-containing protein [Pseudonocardiales bacterium]
MNVKKSVVDSVAVITLTGDLDAHSVELVGSEVLSIMPAHTEVLLDLSEVEHLTSAGLRILLLLYRQGHCLDSAVAVVGLSAELRNVLSASGFLDFFRVADSVSDGIELLVRDVRDDRREPVNA